MDGVNEVLLCPAKQLYAWLLAAALVLALHLAACTSAPAADLSPAGQEGVDARADASNPEAAHNGLQATDESPGMGPEALDLEPACDILLVEEREGCREYQLVFYERATYALTGLADVTVFDDAAGFTDEIVNSLDCETLWPGIDELGFVNVERVSQDEHHIVVVSFGGLDDPAHLRELSSCGILTMEGTQGAPLDAATLMDLMCASGAERMSLTSLGYDASLLLDVAR